MGWLAAQGAFLFIGLALGFVFMVIGLFIGHIIVFDSIALGILSGVACNYFSRSTRRYACWQGRRPLRCCCFYSIPVSAFGL